MSRLASIINTFEASFLAQYANKLLPSHRNALAAMKICRSHQSPKMLVGCTQCDQQRYVPHACGHRNCPHCQAHESQQWLEAITQQGLALPTKHPKKWVVDCQSVGSGEKALIYLGRYLYRGVIQEQDIVACANGKVTFRYQNSKTRQIEFKTVTGEAFLWLLLQHVLPKGFRRARNFGFLHPNSKHLIQVLNLLFKFDPSRALAWMRRRPPMICSCCGGTMKIIETRIRSVFRYAVSIPT